MNKNPINPGYSNQIIINGEPIMNYNSSQIIGEMKTQFMKYEFDHNINEDYITVKSIVSYNEKLNLGTFELSIIEDKCTYRLIRDHDFTSEELYFIVVNATERVIQYFQSNKNIQLEYRQLPYCPQLLELNNQLNILATKLNKPFQSVT